jgi:hypothetical protein
MCWQLKQKELRVTQGPPIIQCGEFQKLPFSILWLLYRFGGVAIVGATLMWPLPSIAQAVNTEQPVVVPENKPKATDPQKDPKPENVNEDSNATTDNGNEPETVDLLTDNLDEHWKVFSSAPATPDSPVWKVVSEGEDKGRVLICSGDPKGFLYTTETCSEFELTLEWKYPRDEDGNSGVLVYTQDEPRIWPTSMQVQLHQPKVGSVFPSGDATSDQSSELANDLARPVNTWNEGKIISRGGRLSVEVNGRKAGEVTGAKPSTGSIALQSEGSVVHFRRIRLRKIRAVKPVATPESVSRP